MNGKASDPDGDLAVWLRQRLDDDERAVVEEREARRDAFGPQGDEVPWDFAAVLRAIAAHRTVLDLYTASVERDGWMREATGEAPLRLATSAYREAVCRLAVIYDGRPGYRAEWRPDCPPSGVRGG